MMLRIEQTEEIIVFATDIAGTITSFQAVLCSYNLRIEDTTLFHNLEEVVKVERLVWSGLETEIRHFLLQPSNIVIQMLDERLWIDGIPFITN